MQTPETTTQNTREAPEAHEDRRRVWAGALAVMDEVDRRRPPKQEEIALAGMRVLDDLKLDEKYLGFAMVHINNAFWLEQFLATPIHERALMLPRCLVDLAPIEERAIELGYRPLVAEGSPEVIKFIARENVTALIGIGCLESLEKVFPKVRAMGAPSVAIPLTQSGCKSTEVDTEHLMWLLESSGPTVAQRTRAYFPSLRIAHRLFDEPEFSELIRPAVDKADDPTVRIALDWLLKDGKRLRPFVTLAAYQAFRATGEPPDGVLRLALAIETFHKASLVHDDVEDNDDLRYGEQTLNRRYGAPVAVNVGDYMIGLGYRLASVAGEEFGDRTAASLTRIFSDTHMRLSRGQGAELIWTRENRRDITLGEVLKHYTLKTSPAFEAALTSAMAAAGVYETHGKSAREFSLHLGAAFQLRNDIRGIESDAAEARPTALLALALEDCDPEERRTLLEPPDAAAVLEIYDRRETVERAEKLKKLLRERALGVAEKAESDYGELMRFLVETILD